MENFEEFDLSANQRSKLIEEYNKQDIPSDLENRTVQELRRRGFFKRSSSFVLKPAISLLILGILFSGGFFLGKNSGQQISSLPSDNLYLFLLYNPTKDLVSESHAKEYGEWFHSLNKKAVTGDELKKGGWSLSINNEPRTIDAMEGEGIATGYFIIQANSDSEALSLAASCPHLKYNGKIEVRPIQTHN